MKVSVIIPFYSNISWLREAVDSALSQTMANYEIIVVNDGSPEDDRDFLKAYGQRIIYQKTQNRGPAHARNFGITIAKGEYLAFLDSDDIWMPEKLEKQVALMDERGYTWSHTKYSVFDEVSEPDKRVFINIKNDDFKGNVFPKCLTHMNIGTPCVMVRRDYLMTKTFIRFSEKMRYGQDGFFWILMGVENELGYIDESLTLVRRLGNNAVQRARVHLDVRANLYKTLVRRFDLYFPNLKLKYSVRLTYKYCERANYLVNFIFRKRSLKDSKAELLSKILYCPAYFLFKKVL